MIETMSSTPISSISNVVSQMQELAKAASTPAPSMALASPSVGGFASELALALKSVSSAQLHANTQAQHFELGKPGVTLNDVMIDMQKANLGFQSVVQVRNKLVSAYQTIASMPL